ncbi:MAG TPA: PaaI family thioesterase [Roseiflexaceae bacterium]
MTTDYTQAVNERLKDTMADLIGLRVTYAEPKRVTGEITVRTDLTQPYGYIHGGALMTLMDTVAGMASALNVGPSEGFLTVEFKINFLRSVRKGRVIAEATAVHVGRRTHVWQVTAHDEQGRQLALATLTQLVIQLRDEVSQS